MSEVNPNNRFDDEHIYELFWRGNERVKGWDLTGRSGSPITRSGLSAYYNNGARTKHVVYLGDDGRLHDISWIFGSDTPTSVDLTMEYSLPHARGIHYY